MRDALDLIDALRFRSQKEKHELSDLYETRIKKMGNAGRNGGEYYKNLIYSHYNDKQQAFLDFVLAQYVSQGVQELQTEKLPALLELKYQGIHDATEELGEVSRIRQLFVGFQRHLFESKATA